MSPDLASLRNLARAERIASLPLPVRAAVRLAKRLNFLVRHGPGYWRQAKDKAPRSTDRERLHHLVHGFDPLEAGWYLQARGHVRGCVSNLHREEYLKAVNGNFGHMLDNKHLFALLAERLGIAHPHLYGHARSGRWRWMQGGREALEQALAGGDKAVLKPSLGKKGAHVTIVRDMAALRAAPGAAREAMKAADMIVTAFVSQADYAAAINPASLNTIRVLTLRPEAGEDAFVAAAVHRFGGAGTGVVDNFSAGGLVAEVDVDSGRMSAAAVIGPGNVLTFRPDHPDTGAEIEGITIPHWEEAKELVVRICADLPQLDYVGWDVAITADGPVIIEGNSHPSLRFFQIFRSLTDDPRIAAFMAKRSIVVPS